MDYSICSFNVRGLGQKTKRKEVFNFLEKKKFQICFLQETHSKLEFETTWTLECRLATSLINKFLPFFCKSKFSFLESTKYFLMYISGLDLSC